MKIAIGIIFSVIISLMLPTLHWIEGIEKEIINTLYTVAGIIFSVGMSLVISVSTSGVKNKEARDVFRSQLKKIRSRFIVLFIMLSLFYVVLPIDNHKKIYNIVTFHELPVMFSPSVLMVSCLLVSVIYYIVNYYSISQSVYQIEDRIEQETEFG